MKILTTTLIKESEKNAVENGDFSFKELMYTAGSRAAKVIMNKYDCKDKKITVVCGKGNNGGDGAVIAEILSNHGAFVTVATPLGAPATENAKFYYENLNLVRKTDKLDFSNTDIIIDALFGIGLDRPLNEDTIEIIEKINRSDAVKISIDIPSGVSADSGKILHVAVKADHTITFIALKPCFVLPCGSDYCGEVSLVDIGVTPEKYSYLSLEKPIFEKRIKNSHKGTYGTALIICGSYGMAGAAILATKAALRSGLGIAKAVVCEGIYAPFTASVPEAVCIPVKQNKLGTIEAKLFNLTSAAQTCDAILFGCGVGNNEDTAKILKDLILNNDLPLVIDADGINALKDSIDLIRNRKTPVILTPHPGEMARLINKTVAEVEENRIEIAGNFAKEYGCILVLKGANTIVALPTGEIFFNITGNPGMATGGSGDVLAGIIVSLSAQGFSPEISAKYAVYLHGEAGDKAALRRGERAMLPSDIIEEL